LVHRIALTGNIASGKSTVVNVWRELGATIIEADVLAREAVAPGTPGLKRIVERWGPGILQLNGELDRAALRDVIFRDPEERQVLESIIHPEVSRLRDDAYAEAARQGVTCIVADIPLLFEVGLQHEFDTVVLVEAPEEMRLTRLVSERKIEESEARRMMDSQWPSEQKRAGADFVIENSGTLDELRGRATEVWEAVVERARERESGV
jgi:dephospho-CoA kinase